MFKKLSVSSFLNTDASWTPLKEALISFANQLEKILPVLKVEESRKEEVTQPTATTSSIQAGGRGRGGSGTLVNAPRKLSQQDQVVNMPKNAATLPPQQMTNHGVKRRAIEMV